MPNVTSRAQARHDRRPRGVTVRPLDLSAYAEAAFESYRAAHPDTEYTRARMEHWAYAVAADGSEYLVSDEGVGWGMDDDPNEFGAWMQSDTQFSMIPSVTVTLTADEIRHVATGDPVDLADFIRTFGARLDRNHAMWFDTLS